MSDIKTKKVPTAKERSVVKEPSMYNVVLLNDHYTPMEFVVLILEQIFQKNQAEATQIMLNVHNHGSGLAGVYTKEIAETKVVQVTQIARHNEHALKCIMEPV
jgi:ATP-dependent Clp protease adaptor protein ClpS